MKMSILKKDLQQNRGATLVMFILITLAAMLSSGGTRLLTGMLSSLDHLFEAAKVPHFIQMHSGSIDVTEIDLWSEENELVDESQIIEMLSLSEANVVFDQTGSATQHGIMDIGLMIQSKQLDYLLDLNNEIAEVAPGEIGIPLYYRQKYQLDVGDVVSVNHPEFHRDFTIATFIRDGQMNSSLVHSKRLLIHKGDFNDLKNQFTDTEYLIEFRLHEPGKANEFGQAYLSSGLPNSGPAIDYVIIKLINAISDGIVAISIIGLSFLLIVIALLCLRFTMISRLEEDWREIGIMKALGLPVQFITRLYGIKYLIIGGPAILLGYLLSIELYRYMARDMLLYLGQSPDRSWAHTLLPVAAAIALMMILLLSCLIILRRINKTSAIDALRTANLGEAPSLINVMPLRKAPPMPLNAWLGIKDLLQRRRLFSLLVLIYFFSACALILPVNFLTTIKSPAFITYLGIGQSDLRIDLQHTRDVKDRYAALLNTLADDTQVADYAFQVTSGYTVVEESGEQSALYIQNGDHHTFPLEYLAGKAPTQVNEIALSALNSQALNAGVGEQVVVLLYEQPAKLTVSGIYQDITHGGRTAKAMLPPNLDTALWYTVSLNLKDPAQLEQQQTAYAQDFYPARVTDIPGYLEQTLGGTVRQLSRVTLTAIALGLTIAVLMTALLMSMILTKDRERIRILHSLGFSRDDIAKQYQVTIVLVMAIGLLLGTWFANTAGQALISAVWAQLGASDITFVIKPLLTYGVLPCLLVVSVYSTTAVCLLALKKKLNNAPLS